MPTGQGLIVLNGRAAARTSVSGVERWAAELIPRLKARDPERYLVLRPPARASSRAPGQVWEQLALPARAALARASLVFSPANLAPLLWPRNVMMLHDAVLLREPEAYSRAYRAWHKRFGLACARRALAVLTVSEFSRRELISLLGLDPEKVIVIRGGVDERFHPDAADRRVAQKLALERPYVLTVATDDRRKNLPALSEAARRLRALGIDLVWAGRATRHIAAADDVDGMRPLGYVDDADLPGLYAGARAFVLPSHYEGLGLPCLEAMACRTPVVAANRAALPETCGDAALLVDPDDRRAIAEAAVRAATDEALRARLCAAGLRRAGEATWERAADQTSKVLLNLSER